MKSLIVFILLLSTAIILAQPPDTLWTRTYGGNLDDAAYSVQQATDGGYIVAGYTMSSGAGNEDFYLVKTDSRGDTMWTHTYGGGVIDIAQSVQLTGDGGYILGGYTRSFGAGSADFYLVKMNSLGVTLWTHTYGGINPDYAYSVQQTGDGGYILAGYTFSFGAGQCDFYLVKTNSQGDTLWTHTYGGRYADYAYSVRQTSDGGYIVAGLTYSFGVGLADIYLVKTNSRGDSLWTHTYGGSDDDCAYSVQQTSDGGYIVAGYTESFGAGYSDFYLVKTDSRGDTLWTHTYGGNNTERAWSIQQSVEGGYIVAGYTGSFGAGSYDFYLVKTNSQGGTLWTRTFGGSDADAASCVQQTSDAGYIVAGWTYSFGAGSYDFYLVKTGAESSVEPISISLPLRYSLHPNYPNPFNPSTRIAYDLPSPNPVTLEIFDLLGRHLTTLVNGTQPAGSYSIPFDGSALPSGLYFYRLQAGAFTQTQKMVLLK